MSNVESDAGFLGLKELSQLRELTLMMGNIRDDEIDALEDAMPNTRINAMSGGSKRAPRKDRLPKPGASIQDGPVEARKDIQSEQLKYMLCGQPQAHDAIFAEVLMKDHKITLVVVGCNVPELTKKRADEYNEVVLNHLEKLGKKDVIREAEAKARKQWEQARAKSSLLDKAIEDFNLKAKSDPIYKGQPPLTKKEVIEAVQNSQKLEFPKVTDALFKTFKRIADAENLPPNAVFHAHNDLVDCGDCVVDAWEVRLGLPKDDGGVYFFTIRKRQLGQTRTLAAEADRIEKMLRDTPALPGRYRLEDRVKELRQRAAKLKAGAND